jgi:hypothetical protein
MTADPAGDEGNNDASSVESSVIVVVAPSYGR